MGSIRQISKEKDSIELEIDGENETLLEPLKQRLLEDEKVETATYIRGHPQLDKTKLYVKVKDGKPQAAIKRAAKSLAKDFSDIRKLFEKEAGQFEG